MTTDPQRTFEVERKYDADAGTPLPDWARIPAVTSVTEGELRELDARYLDTDDRELAQHGIALRRRTGGPDAGWHIIAQWTTAELHPIARIENTRTAFHLMGEGGMIAEFVDDHVRATDLRAQTHSIWREWEMELGPAAPADEAGREVFFSAVEQAVLAAGGRPPSSGSKLARALGA